MNKHKQHCIVAMGLCLIFLGSLRGVTAARADTATVLEETELMFIGEDLYTVSIASRKAEPLRRAPAAVTVIQADELKKYRTLAEVLHRVPGFFIDRNELKERVYLRGVADSFLVMMDGVPFASDASTTDYPRGMELSLDYIEKIEIIRGPGSSLWGPDAFSGTVNLVTKKGGSVNGLSVKTQTGSYDTRGASALGGFSRQGWDVFLFGSTSNGEGFESDLTGGKKRHKDRYTELYGKVSYRDVLEISGRYSRYRDYYTLPDYLSERSEHKPFSFIQATLNKSFENASVSLQAWHQFFDNLEDNEFSRYEQTNRQYGLELKYDQSLFGNNFVTLGTSLRYNSGSKTKFKYQDTDFDYFPSYHTDLFSAYFQDKWKILDNLETTVGIRYDNHSEYSHFFSPRAGINYLFWKYFSLKLLYGRAFRTPSLAVVIEKSGLDPERIDSYEIELGFHYRNIFNLEANYFYNDLKDIIERNALGAISNKGDEQIKGVEVSMWWKPHRKASLYGSCTHLFGDRQRGTRTTQAFPNPEDPTETVESTLESFLNVAPDNIYTIGADYRPCRFFSINAEMHYVDKRRLAEGGSDSGGPKRLSSYVTVDLHLLTKDFPFNNVEMGLTIKNITNESFSTRGVFNQVRGEGRSMFFTVGYTF